MKKDDRMVSELRQPRVYFPDAFSGFLQAETPELEAETAQALALRRREPPSFPPSGIEASKPEKKASVRRAAKRT